MLTLTEVRAAIKQGERKRGITLLKTILQENPTADAWCLAARLTEHKQTALRYVRQALILDPQHNEALTMLHDLGGTRRSFYGMLADETLASVYEQCSRSPLLSRLPPGAQLAVFSLLMLAMLGGLGLAIGLFVSSRQPALPKDPPETQPVVLVSAGQMADRLRASSLALVDLEIVSGAEAGEAAQVIRFSLEDAAANQYPVEIQVYDSIGALIAAWNALPASERPGRVVSQTNAVLTYPEALSPPLAQYLVRTFRSAAGA